MSNNQSNFSNNNTLIAIVLSAIVLFGWQYYLGKKYPNLGVKTTTTLAPAEVAASTEANLEKSNLVDTNKSVKKNEKKSDAAPLLQKLAFSNEEVQFDLFGQGMSLGQITLKKHLSRDKNPIHLGLAGGLFEVKSLGNPSPLIFEIKEVAAGEFVGTAKEAGATVLHKMKLGSDSHSITHSIEVQNPTADFKGLTIEVPEFKAEQKSSSFLLPSFDHQEFIVRHSTNTERFAIDSTQEDIDKKFSEVSLVGIGSQYFTTAILDKSEIIPDVSLLAKVDGKQATASLIYKYNPGTSKMNLSFVTYAGPKDYHLLQKLDKGFGDIVNFGFFSSIATVLLSVMKWFYGFVGNWGWSIVLLTLLVRLVVLPFNISSFKSMKKMQKIQPMMQSLRERYKDDAPALNREMMALMKEHQVNPIGGCLPMLLQMPVFFALYQVLAQSIDLYQAPFILWIQDLSIKDPYYILPVLMGITMFAQQKMTPSTMDATQQKVMQFMPIIFSFMMISLPSGLTLYIFISTLFGVIQQQIFMKDRTAHVSNKAVKV